MNELRTTDPLSLEPLDAAFRSLLRPWRAEGVEPAPQIRLDVDETDQAYRVKAEIPGVKRDDIDVRIDGSRITISAEVKRDHEERKGGRVLRSERAYGYASRAFTLAQDVDETQAQARYADGVLDLTLPKKPASGARRVTVS